MHTSYILRNFEMMVDFKYQMPFSEKDSAAAAASEAKLRENLKETIRKSGVLDAVKAQIRHEFIAGISIKKPDSSKYSSLFDFRERAICSIVFHFLKRRSLTNSLSVFVAECGLSDKSSVLSETDLLETLKFNAVRNSYKVLHNLEGSKQKLLLENLLTSSFKEKKRDTLLDLLLHFSLSINEDKSKEMETQTQITGPGVRESLDLHLSQLRDSYVQNAVVESRNPQKSIEERMISFQRDCEERMRRDLELQIKNYKETSAMKIRLEEAQKARLSVETLRKELEADYSRRLQFHLDREDQTTKRFAEQERQFNQSQYDARQIMQREIDELRNREQMSARKIELESQGLKVLELRVKEAQTLVENRERELSSREKKLVERESTAAEQARREARDQVRLELEQLQTDRAALAVERQRVHDDRASQLALVESASTLKNQLKIAHNQIEQREDEIASLRKTAERIQMIRLEEEANLTHIMSSVDPKMHEYSKAQQIIKLVEKNAGLEIELASLKDSAMLKADSAKKQKEIARLEEILRNQSAKLEMSSVMARQEIEQLSTALSTEKSKVAAFSHKMDELQRLLKDKTQTIDSLRRQLDRSNREGLGDSQGMKRTTAFEMPKFREQKSMVPELRNRDTLRQRDYSDEMYVADPNNALQRNSDMNNAIAGQMEIISAKLYRDISEKLLLQQQQQYMGSYYAPPSAYHPLPTAPLYTAPPMPPSTHDWQLPVPVQQPPLLQSLQSRKQYDTKPVSDAPITKAETTRTNLMDNRRVEVPAELVSTVSAQWSTTDVPGSEVFAPKFKADVQTETTSPQPAKADEFDSEKLKILAASTTAKEEQDHHRRIAEERDLRAAKQLQEQKETEMKLAKEMEEKQAAAIQQQQREEELRQAELAREEELRRKLREDADREAEEEKSREAAKVRVRQREQEAKEAEEALRIKEAQAEQDRLEREQQLAAEQQKEKAAELEREQALKREEELRLLQEREREQEAKRKEDDDAAMIQEARARVLARRKQKQMRDSGESLASSVSVSASSTMSFRNEHNLHETAPFNSLVSTSASMQAPSASLDVAASVSLPSSSISRSAATASYRYKDADKVDSDEAEQDDDDGQKGYESSFFGSRDRSSRWTASQERANDNRSQAQTSIPEISKDSDDSDGGVQFEHGNNTLDESEDQWS